MNIDKNIGRWIPDAQREMFGIEYIDDLAYHLYCQYRKLRKKENITHQMSVIQNKKVYEKFYNDAKVLIRAEKILKFYKKENIK